MSDNPPQLDRLTRIEALQLQWNRYAEEMINLRRQNTDYLEGVRSGRGKRLVEEIKSEYDEFVSTERRARMGREEAASRNTVIVVASYLAFSLSLTALLAFFGRRELLRLSAAYGHALAQGQELAAAMQAQTWLREGQRRLADSMAGRQELGAQSHNALEFLTRYLGSAVGALYVREDNGRLERVASWGFSNNEAPQGRSFAGSDSVVAEVATSGKPVRLENLPANYIRVTSGLGHGAPQSVLVAPIVNAGQATGVVELGFLRPLAPRDTDLLEMVALSLGASVKATLYRQRVQNLLEQTQKLNEGMQVNKEELRIANEELEEQSRALKESPCYYADRRHARCHAHAARHAGHFARTSRPGASGTAGRGEFRRPGHCRRLHVPAGDARLAARGLGRIPHRAGGGKSADQRDALWQQPSRAGACGNLTGRGFRDGA